VSENVETQIQQLRTTIATLEAQRSLLGDAIVDGAAAPLRQQLAALEAQATAESKPVEERQLVTILFTDIVGSTAFAEKLDPEEWRQTVAQLHSTVGNLIAGHQGTVAQYLGDGLLAFFGAQLSSERDSENAIRAALDAQSALSSEEFPHPIQIRIGIHTGLVVVGELGADAHKEFTATGDAMNLAARLQSAAPPGGILISHDTYRYVRGVFDVTPQPPLIVKGKSEPIQTYLVRRAKPRPFRTVTRGVAGIETRTVGRETEFKRLQEVYLDAYENRRVVWAQLVSEAGVGKSRLVSDVDEWLDLRPEEFRLLRARAYPGDAGQPYALIRRMWFDRFQIAEDAPLPQAEVKWVQRFHELAGTQEVEPAHALGLLVGLPFDDSPYIGAMRNDPVQVKGRAFVVSRELLGRVRSADPVVMLLEDLQWADASSLEWLTEVVLGGDPGPPSHGDSRWSLRAAESARAGAEGNGLFVLATARPEWTPPDSLRESGGARYFRIDLAPLSDEAGRELAHELLQNVEGVPEEVIRLLVERSEGVPYYAEEMVNWFLDRGIIDRSSEPWRFVVGRLRESPLPATLQHLLLTRLSALSDTERAALQRGAIFGRNFWAGGVEALGVRRSAEVLGDLQPRGLVQVQPESSFEGETEWSFPQTLMREVTYESVLKRERAALHKAAAKWLEEQAAAAGRLDEFAGLLGEHAERAGDMSAAADWYLRAGERAKAQGAPLEAKKSFDHALELLPPIERERRWKALLGREEAAAVLGEPKAWQADLTALLELAKEFDDDNRLAEVYHRQGNYSRLTGDSREARRAAEEALAAARRSGNAAIEVKALSLRAQAEARLGESEASVRSAEEALERARGLGDESTLALVLHRAAFCYNDIGDLAKAMPLQIEQIEMDRRLGNRDQEGGGLTNLGVLYVALGAYKQARVTLEQALQISEALGSRRGRAYGLLNLAGVHWLSGDLRTGLRLVEQSLEEMTASGDRSGRAAALHGWAEGLEDSGDAAGAVRRFAEAKEIFMSLGELPAVYETSAGLARCALAQGRLDEARQLAVEVWNYLQGHSWVGMDSPAQMYETCAEIFDALGDAAASRAAIERGYRELMQAAQKISAPEWRKSFLENNRFNRAMVEMWERLQASP
jgi:class 3 adenylate cyclase/tetratricopeptide (TPR) repeat protein